MRVLAILVAICATPVVAQDRMTPEQCTQSLSALVELAGVPIDLPAAAVNDEGWCNLTDVTIARSQMDGFKIAAVRWRTSDIARFVDEGLPPRSIEFDVTGVSAMARTGDDVFDYLLGLQMSQDQLSFGATVRWDALSQTLNMDSAYVAFDGTNRIDASARIEGVNLTDVASMQTSLGTAGLRNLAIKTQFDGWFETKVAMAAGTALLTASEDAPDVQVAHLQRQAVEVLSDIPTSILPEQSRVSLGSFINSLPTPRGTLEVQISADPTFGVMRGARFSNIDQGASFVETLEAGLDGVTALVIWSPTGGTQ